MSGWLMLACAKPDKNKKGNALGGAQPISSSAYSPVVRWLTHLVSEFYIRQKTRRNCSAIYGAAVNRDLTNPTTYELQIILGDWGSEVQILALRPTNSMIRAEPSANTLKSFTAQA